MSNYVDFVHRQQKLISLIFMIQNLFNYCLSTVQADNFDRRVHVLSRPRKVGSEKGMLERLIFVGNELFGILDMDDKNNEKFIRNSNFLYPFVSEETTHIINILKFCGFEILEEKKDIQLGDF